MFIVSEICEENYESITTKKIHPFYILHMYIKSHCTL